jgi:hypothetical protein
MATDSVALLDDLRAAFRRYVAFPDEHASAAITLWIAATHVLPVFEFAPRLVVSSPEKRCGKTRALDIVGGTCHRPLATVNASVAAIYRSINGDHPPTLIIDEADALFGTKKVAENHEDLRALINAGFQRGRPALRCVGPLQIPTEFPTFAMAAIAGIHDMPDTITDRAINIALRRRAPGERVSQFRSRRDGPRLAALRERLAAWASEHLDKLTGAEPEMPVEDRAADTWEPLVAIADLAGGHWPDTARDACMALVDAAEQADEAQSFGVKLLTDIKGIFADYHTSFISSHDLVRELRDIEDSPWTEFDYNASKLAYRLREFGIKPGHNSAKTARGYNLKSFHDAFRRYTRPDPSERPKQDSDQHQQADSEKHQTVRNPSEGVRTDGSGRLTDVSNEPEKSAKIAGHSDFSDVRTVTDAPPAKNWPFVPPTGPGRCLECHWHVPTQGHAPDCPANKWKRPR